MWFSGTSAVLSLRGRAAAPLVRKGAEPAKLLVLVLAASVALGVLPAPGALNT